MISNFQKHFVLTALVCFISISAFSQWTKGKGKGYYKISAWYLEADQHYTDTGNIDPNTTRGQFNINFYGEYGLSDKLDAIVYFPFFSRAYENDVFSGTTGELISEGEAVNSIGDLDLAIRYGLLKNEKLALSTTLKFGLPTGKNDGGSDGSFQTGDGEFNQQLQVDLGVPFILGNTAFYSKAYLGFNNRTKDFSDELRTGLEFGANIFNKKVWLIGRSDVVKSLRNGSLSAQTNQGSIFANNVEYVSIAGEVNYYITKKFGASITFAGAVSGRIIYARPSLSGGLFLDIK